MKRIIYLPAATRGNSSIGWLNGFHSFNLAHFYNVDRVPFGPLVVFNDDTVQPNSGFPTHHHSNMEIISIPLKGVITHRDSTGQEVTIKAGDVQLMSAGKGISHSEYNLDIDNELNSLQIWIVPKLKNVEPRYQQLSLTNQQANAFNQIVSPEPTNNSLWIHQDAWIFLGKFSDGFAGTHQLKKEGDGLYLFVLSGTIKIEGYELNPKDAISMQGISTLDFEIIKDAEILLIEIPLGN